MNTRIETQPKESDEQLLLAAAEVVRDLGPDRAAIRILAVAFLALKMNGVIPSIATRRLVEALLDHDFLSHKTESN